MPTQEQSNTTSALTLDTPTTLGSAVTTAKIMQLVLNLANLTATDVLIVRIKTKVLTGSTEQVEFEHTYQGAQTEKNVRSTPVGSVHSWVAELEQTDGTGRTFEWAYVSL